LRPAVPLDAELLLGSADLARSVGVEVGLFQFLDEGVDVGSGGLDDGLFAVQSGGDESVRVDADGPVEVVVAVLEFLDEGDGLLVGRTELPSHCKVGIISPECRLMKGDEIFNRVRI
jgi:hypothetical protein